MTKMKRFLALGMAAMMILTAAGCGDKNKDTKQTDGSTEEFPKVDLYTNAEVQDLGGYEFMIVVIF